MIWGIECLCALCLTPLPAPRNKQDHQRITCNATCRSLFRNRLKGRPARLGTENVRMQNLYRLELRCVQWRIYQLYQDGEAARGRKAVSA